MDAILTFHSIDRSGSVLSYPPEDLDALLTGLLAHGACFVPLREVLQAPPAGRDRVALTFDDGIRSVGREALPILKRLGLPATVYVVSGWVGRTSRWPSARGRAPEFPLMDWAELREMARAGIEVGAHGASHTALTALGDGQWEDELRGCRDRIQDELQIPVRDFAYPYGRWNRAALRRVGGVFATAVTTTLRFVRRGDSPLLLPRIDSYYLRGPWARSSLFGRRSRLHLRLRAVPRRLRPRWAP